jgi:hypothetical protein
MLVEDTPTSTDNRRGNRSPGNEVKNVCKTGSANSTNSAHSIRSKRAIYMLNLKNLLNLKGHTHVDWAYGDS